jgi:hypothetical protein
MCVTYSLFYFPLLQIMFIFLAEIRKNKATNADGRRICPKFSYNYFDSPQFFRRFTKISKMKYYLRRVCLLVRTSIFIEHFCSRWKNFREIWFLRIFLKSVGTIRFLLKSDKNIGYFTWSPVYFFYISSSCFLRMRNVSDKFVEKIKRHISFSVTFSFPKIAPFMRQCGKIL